MVPIVSIIEVKWPSTGALRVTVEASGVIVPCAQFGTQLLCSNVPFPTAPLWLHELQVRWVTTLVESALKPMLEGIRPEYETAPFAAWMTSTGGAALVVEVVGAFDPEPETDDDGEGEEEPWALSVDAPPEPLAWRVVEPDWQAARTRADNPSPTIIPTRLPTRTRCSCPMRTLRIITNPDESADQKVP